ncbi:MAG TPA: ComEC/Rec2 family competence protein, partial [Alphaproteobacteria bacterium]|nr:ComEC/Rec2 family competence protein [Alphaproteobacteria bacterium]
MQSALQVVFKSFLDERARWVLWLPVFMGLGIGLYFTGHAEPPLWPALLAAGVLIVACLIFRHSVVVLPLLALLMIALGFCAAKLETLYMTQPMLSTSLEGRMVTGRVMGISRLDEGYRLTLQDISVEGLPAEQTPHRVRIKFRFSTKLPRPGAWINVKATLHPLSGPVEPGAFNFRRFAFFGGYGGTGFAMGYWHYADGPPPGFGQRVALFFENTRKYIADKMAGDTSRENAVALALVTGDQSGIARGTMQAMRISGISHILSVSGLHIAMVAGVVFFTLRALMALWPWLALHWPIKKIAAGAAL